MEDRSHRVAFANVCRGGREGIQYFLPSFIPINSESKSHWFSLGMKCDALYNSMLLVSLAYQSLLRGHDILPSKCYQYRGETLRLINEGISKPHAQAEDGTIAAVAYLTVFEVSIFPP